MYARRDCCFVRCLPFLQWLPRTVVRHLPTVLWGHSDVFRPVSASSGCTLSANTLRCHCFLGYGRSQGHITTHNCENWSPGSPFLLDRESSTRSRQTSQVPESTLCTHAPLLEPGWLDDTTVTECLRVLPSASMQSVGFPRLYNFSVLNDAACVLASTVLHGYPHGIPRRICYRPADGLWPGGDFHPLVDNNPFHGSDPASNPKVSVI